MYLPGEQFSHRENLYMTFVIILGSRAVSEVGEAWYCFTWFHRLRKWVSQRHPISNSCMRAVSQVETHFSSIAPIPVSVEWANGWFHLGLSESCGWWRTDIPLNDLESSSTFILAHRCICVNFSRRNVICRTCILHIVRVCVCTIIQRSDVCKWRNWLQKLKQQVFILTNYTL